ncbi:MAG: ABC transporter ATP-binding protein [Spirochaetes bacterium]|nr:ABC transporter ATP-binding protein [Spirochaetota bacterium]
MQKKIHFKASFKEIAVILFKNSKKIRVLFPLELFFVAIDGFVASRLPVLLKFFVDGIQKDIDLFLKEKLIIGIILSLAMAFSWYISAMIQHYLKEKISTNIMINVQSSLYSHLQNLSLDFYQNTYIGEITTRLTNDIYQSIKELYFAFMHTIWILFMLVPSVYTMIKFNVNFFWIFFVFMLVFGVLLKTIMPVIRKKERNVQDQRGNINAKITEHIYSMSLIKAFAKESETAETMKKEFNLFLSKALTSARTQIIFNDFLNMFVTYLAPTLLLCLGVVMRLTTGELVAFFSYWTIAGARVRSIIEISNRIFIAIASFDRVIEFFKKSPLVKDDSTARPISITKGSITFRNVNFKYPLDEKMIINNLNLKIKEKTRVGLVGQSGAGKTTILNLILRFYDPVSGTIYIDEDDIKSVQQKTLRQNIGVVLQDTILLNGTIKENMLFVKPDASDQEIIDSLKKAQIWDYLQMLPEGINTTVGERGVKLSGGQRQRLSIARVFLKDPAILLFDEATSSVDSQTEHDIYKTMQELLKSRTSVIITHRLSTIFECDQIVVLDKGKVIDIGSHKELYSRCDLYKKLCDQQNFN